MPHLVSRSPSRRRMGLLYGVTTFDPLTILAGVVMIVTAALASAIPARRAATVDPAITLRAE